MSGGSRTPAGAGTAGVWACFCGGRDRGRRDGHISGEHHVEMGRMRE
jgi:hypothetical protein